MWTLLAIAVALLALVNAIFAPQFANRAYRRGEHTLTDEEVSRYRSFYIIGSRVLGPVIAAFAIFDIAR